jgi:hypothetical protein
MGKNKKAKKRNRSHAVKTKSVRPDDYFRYGPLEMARFGETIVSRSNMSEEQFRAMQDRLVARFPEVCGEIDETVNKIAELVKMLPPAKILHRAAWGKAAHHLGKKTEVEIDIEAGMSLRMIDYVQSIIVAVPPVAEQEDELTEERWQELEKLVHDLFMQLNTEFMVCQTAVNRREPSHDEEFDEFYFKAQMMWCNVRGKRYVPHEIPFYRDVLSPHNDVLKEIYGVGVEEILDSLHNIQDSATRGIPQATIDLHEFRRLTLDKLDEKLKGLEFSNTSELPEFRELMEQVVKENDWESLRADVFGRFLGLNIFDLEKITKLPRLLLEDLSLEPGQDKDFFAEGQYKGWPLRIWPVFRYPFIKLNGHFYCFEPYSLFDNLYRIIQRIITNNRPEYGQVWNDKQKELSEQIPIELFSKLLPGAQVFHPVYYRWRSSPESSKQWCEADILVVYEDHLFIIEVKAGAFTYTPPTTDFPAYAASLKNLVLKPAEQGNRFLEYLRSEKDVMLYDENHKEIGKLSGRNFEHVTLCAVTLDSFTEIAGQVQHLKKIGVDVGANHVWSISIDDLRVYSDLFDNPLIFLHFVEQRMRAFHSDLIRTDDELDHLGLYIKHNVYTEYVKDFKKMDFITWYGYRSDIDRYYYEKMLDPAIKSPLRQKMPFRLEEIINFLNASTKPDRRKIASLILDSSGDMREGIASGIDELLALQPQIGRVRPLAVYGCLNITIFCWQNVFFKHDRKLAVEHSYATMLVTNDAERLLIELFYDNDGRLCDMNFDFLKLADIPDENLGMFKIMAEDLRVKRIEDAKRTAGKIGRNEQCPCGSGKKHKKCCGERFH